MTDFRPGDIVQYTPERRDHWCREGLAVAELRKEWRDFETDRLKRDAVVLFDTYWGISGSDRHVLTSAERDTAEVLFNLEDVEPIDTRSGRPHRQWMRYAPADRFVVTSQHRLDAVYYVRRGAEIDRGAELEQQRLAVEKALQERDSALSELQWQRNRYHEMLADPTVRPWGV